MIRLKEDGWKIFECYTRNLLCEKPTLYDCKVCNYKAANEEYHNLLLGCNASALVADIVSAAKKTRNTLFYSVNRSYPLIDAIYQDDQDAFHAFQVTVGLTHDADETLIANLEKDVGLENNLSLYYLVPSDNFAQFKTKPVYPTKDRTKGNVWKVLIPNPNYK